MSTKPLLRTSSPAFSQTPFAQLFQSVVRPPSVMWCAVVTYGASESSPFVPITSRPSASSVPVTALFGDSPVGVMPCALSAL